MNILDYVIISVVAIWFLATVFYLIRMRKQGKHSCGGNCASCCSGCKQSH